MSLLSKSFGLEGFFGGGGSTQSIGAGSRSPYIPPTGTGQAGTNSVTIHIGTLVGTSDYADYLANIIRQRNNFGTARIGVSYGIA
jgi:hypothetical protein